MTSWLIVVCLLALPAAIAQQVPQAIYDAGTRTWSLSNGLVEAQYRLNDKNLLRLHTLRQAGGKQWVSESVPASSPIFLNVDGSLFDADIRWDLLETWVEPAGHDGLRHVIRLADAQSKAEVVLFLAAYAGQPFIRTSYTYKNTGKDQQRVFEARFLNLGLNAGQGQIRAFYLNQFRPSSTLLFDPLEKNLSLEPDQAVRLFTGAYMDQCTWLALADAAGSGIVMGWESNARARVEAALDSSTGVLSVQGTPVDLYTPLEEGQQFAVPASFVGLYQGDWDDAGDRTHRFVDSVLAGPAPDENFPYVMFDTWGYGEKIDERTLRRAARIAADMGVESFIVDLGWARRIGDWVEDPAKFPSGLRAFSDYVHDLGMKFGLHFVPVEADNAAQILIDNPDWTSSLSNGYFEAESLCLSHEPVQQWLRQTTVDIIGRYNADWFVQDGENLVKECLKDSHTHDPSDSNWANSVSGIDAFIKYMRATAPRVHWEDNADGGIMSTFEAVKDYATLASCDACAHGQRRYAVYGMSYAFPPRLISRYMGDEPSRFTARSSMFGGPWILMQQITAWTPAEIDLMRHEIAIYKQLRKLIGEGKVYHLVGPPAGDVISAIESFSTASNRGVIFVYRSHSPVSSQTIFPRGLDPAALYRVEFEEGRESFLKSGANLMAGGIEVQLPGNNFAEIVYITGQ